MDPLQNDRRPPPGRSDPGGRTPPRRRARLGRAPVLLRLGGILGWAAWLGAGFGWPARAGADETDEFFGGTNVPRVVIRLGADAVATLEQHRGPGGGKTRAEGTVRVDGRAYTNVSLQLKGTSTFSPIHDRPSFTLKFDRHVPGQRLHGLAKISLNNSQQDSTRLHEQFAREIYAAAGVPVPRARAVSVVLNGRDLGLYVLTEGFDRRFLNRNFGAGDGVLYEWGPLRDVDTRARIVAGAEPGGDPLGRLVEAAQLADPDERYASLARLLDLTRFFDMMAIETILCHSDSYSMNRNNYRLYYRAETGRFTFIPHGMDRILGGHRSGLDLSIVPPQLGLISRALLTTPVGRRAYLDRLTWQVTNRFKLRELTARIHRMDACLQVEKEKGNGANGEAGDAADLCQRLATRLADVSLQLSALAGSLRAPAWPAFDAAGRWKLAGWVWRPLPRAPGALSSKVEPVSTNGHAGFRVSAPGGRGPVSATFVRRLTLPAGRYGLAGGWRVSPGAGSVEGSVSLLRSGAERFLLHRVSLDWPAVDTEIRVSPKYAPEEIELICEVRSSAPEIVVEPELVLTPRTPVRGDLNRLRRILDQVTQ